MVNKLRPLRKLRKRPRGPLGKRSLSHVYPEPGYRVFDLHPDDVIPERPEIVGRNVKIPAYAIRDQYVAYEGLGACLMQYIGEGNIDDPKLTRLWKIARKAMHDIVDYLDRIPTPKDAKEYRKFPQRLKTVRELQQEIRQEKHAHKEEEEETPVKPFAPEVLDIGSPLKLL